MHVLWLIFLNQNSINLHIKMTVAHNDVWPKGFITTLQMLQWYTTVTLENQVKVVKSIKKVKILL